MADREYSPEVGDVVLWRGKRHRVVHLYGGDDIVIESIGDLEDSSGPFDVLWFDVEFLHDRHGHLARARPQRRLGDCAEEDG
jgi:hypothetical protein